MLLLLGGFLTYLLFGSSALQTPDTTRVADREKILTDRLAEDQKMLHDQPSWFSKDKGLVRIPIERAMSITVAELSQAQPHPAYPISKSPPQPASALASYGSLAPGKSTKGTSNLPAGAQPAGSPALAPAAALPVATPAAASPDAAAAVGGSSPAPAPASVVPPAPAAMPSPAAIAPPAIPAGSPAPAENTAPSPGASPSVAPAPAPTATP